MDLLGQSVFDFIHPCDHSDLRDICGINKSNSSSDVMKPLSAISSMPSLSLQGLLIDPYFQGLRADEFKVNLLFRRQAEEKFFYEDEMYSSMQRKVIISQNQCLQSLFLDNC